MKMLREIADLFVQKRNDGGWCVNKLLILGLFFPAIYAAGTCLMAVLLQIILGPIKIW